jgi:hypothetical protein
MDESTKKKADLGKQKRDENYNENFGPFHVVGYFRPRTLVRKDDIFDGSFSILEPLETPIVSKFG